MAPGRKFSITTSAPSIRRRATSLPLADFMSSARLRLLRPVVSRLTLWPATKWLATAQLRWKAPSNGSTATTSAPMSASSWAAIGPAWKWLKLMTLKPESMRVLE